MEGQGSFQSKVKTGKSEATGVLQDISWAAGKRFSQSTRRQGAPGSVGSDFLSHFVEKPGAVQQTKKDACNGLGLRTRP